MRIPSSLSIPTILIALSAIALIALTSCTGGKSSRPGWVQVRFSTEGAQDSDPIDLEIVSTTAERMKGLMYRHEMPHNEGMIFIFPDEQVQSFWMRNTYISLDMLFVDTSLKVVGILERVPVLNDQPRSVGIPSMYVIELNGGAASQLGIRVGSQVKIEGVLPRGT